MGVDRVVGPPLVVGGHQDGRHDHPPAGAVSNMKTAEQQCPRHTHAHSCWSNKMEAAKFLVAVLQIATAGVHGHIRNSVSVYVDIASSIVS